MTPAKFGDMKRINATRNPGAKRRNPRSRNALKHTLAHGDPEEVRRAESMLSRVGAVTLSENNRMGLSVAELANIVREFNKGG